MTQKQRDRVELVGAAVFLAGCLVMWPPLALLAFGALAVLYANFKTEPPAPPSTKKEGDDASAD